jgi:tRNA (uracil-5-)-methyltransferase
MVMVSSSLCIVSPGKENFKSNGITNAKVLRLSSEEFSAAYLDRRPFQRLQEAAVRFEDYHLTTVLVDPPRYASIDPLLR